MCETAWEGDAIPSLDPTASPSRREPVVAGQESTKRETISSSALATHSNAVQLPAMDATPQIFLIPVAVRLLRCTGPADGSTRTQPSDLKLTCFLLRPLQRHLHNLKLSRKQYICSNIHKGAGLLQPSSKGTSQKFTQAPGTMCCADDHLRVCVCCCELEQGGKAARRTCSPPTGSESVWGVFELERTDRSYTQQPRHFQMLYVRI